MPTVVDVEIELAKIMVHKSRCSSAKTEEEKIVEAHDELRVTPQVALDAKVKSQLILKEYDMLHRREASIRNWVSKQTHLKQLCESPSAPSRNLPLT